MSRSKIEWTESTWNPVRGCTKISPGCKHCYAETFAERWRSVPGHPYEQGFDLRLVPEKLSEPLRRKKPTTYFVCSMSDLFHKDVPFEHIAAVFGVAAACPQHTFQLLTKRPERMLEFFRWLEKQCAQRLADAPPRAIGWQLSPRELCVQAARELDVVRKSDLVQAYVDPGWPLPNVWMGVSVENRKHGLPRIDELRATPAAVRFLSVEPLLEDLGEINLTGIDWVIVGGESGPNARPMHPHWARSIRDQVLAQREFECQHSDHDIYPKRPCRGCGESGPARFSGPAFFFKQWGEWTPHGDAQRKLLVARDGHATSSMFYRDYPEHGDARDGWTVMHRVGKKSAGRLLDGRTWDEMPSQHRRQP